MKNHPFLRFLVRLFWYSDTMTIRVLIAVSSFLFAALLLVHIDIYTRPAFQGMALIAPAWLWALLFLMHWAGVFWRIWENMTRGVRRPGWAVCINGLGFFLWFTSTVMIGFSVGVVSPQIAMEITVVIASLISMLRSGLNDQYNPGLYALGIDGSE